MIRKLLIALSIVALSAAGILPDTPDLKGVQKLSVKILTPNEFNQLLAANPDTVLTPLKKVTGRAWIRYTLGARVSGDSLVALGSDSYSWPSPQDVTLSLGYPSSGVGRPVTYVDILVEQSSTLGDANLVGGGIGSQYIAIVVRAYSTLFLNYRAEIYGL